MRVTGIGLSIVIGLLSVGFGGGGGGLKDVHPAAKEYDEIGRAHV